VVFSVVTPFYHQFSSPRWSQWTVRYFLPGHGGMDAACLSGFVNLVGNAKLTEFRQGCSQALPVAVLATQSLCMSGDKVGPAPRHIGGNMREGATKGKASSHFGRFTFSAASFARYYSCLQSLCRKSCNGRVLGFSAIVYSGTTFLGTSCSTNPCLITSIFPFFYER